MPTHKNGSDAAPQVIQSPAGNWWTSMRAWQAPSSCAPSGAATWWRTCCRRPSCAYSARCRSLKAGPDCRPGYALSPSEWPSTSCVAASVPPVLVPDLDAPDAADPADVERDADRDATDELVRTALAKLPEKYRLPLVYAAIDGLDYDTIATMLAIPVGTVKTNVHRGKQLLRERLEGSP